MDFTPHVTDEVAEMLATVGAASVSSLFDSIPPKVRLGRDLDIPAGVSEMEIMEEMRRLATANLSTDELICFAGAGSYDHFIPSVVWALAGRSEYYTSYTPYQAELAQGVLQTLFEYQSMICEITGLDVSNASLYDGPTALAEAVNLANDRPDRNRVLVSAAVDHRYVEILQTYGHGAGYSVERFDVTDGRGGQPDLGDDVIALVVQHPNAHGILEPAGDLFARARERDVRAIQIFDPLSLGVLASPGDLGADIAVGEGQVLGNPLNFGGPYLGLLAARSEYVRRLPGRIVGETVDVDGRTGYVLTLQAREQHIRREKATSNICTNQTLMAVAATIYLAWLGPDGLRELGERCAAKAMYAAERLCQIDGVELLHPDAPFFKEFALRLPRDAAQVRDALIERGFLAGVPLPEAGGTALLIAVTERRTRAEIDALASAMAEVLA